MSGYLCLAQYDDINHEIDSVLEVCNDTKIHDTIRAESYTVLISLYFTANIEAVEQAGAEGIQFINNAKKRSSGDVLKKLKGTESTLYINLGVTAYQLNRLDESLELWYHARDIKEALGDRKGTANVLNNIANVEIDLGELEKAEKNFEIILNIQKEIADSNGIGRTYNSIGYIHRINGNDSLALDYYQKSLEIRKAINNQPGIAACHNNIGFIYKQRGDCARAIEEYEKARAIYIDANDQIGYLTVLNNLANCYFDLGDVNKAKALAAEGYKIARDYKKENELVHLTEILYRIHKSQNNYNLALTFFEEHTALKDTIESKENYKTLISKELEYAFKEKEKINELNREKEKALDQLRHESELDLANERSFRLTLIILLVSIGLITVLILLFFIRKQKSLIEKQTKELELVALRSQMNPHFLFNSLNSIKLFIIENEKELSARYLTKFSKLVRMVLENSNKNLITLEEELEATQYYLELEQIRFKGRFDYEIINDSDGMILLPPLVLQPYVENAIWHGIMHLDAPGKISIRTKEIQNAVVIEIADNGVGREKARELKAKNHQKNSMGMAITQKRIQSLNELLGVTPKIEITDVIENNEVCGTLVTIVIPFNEKH